MNIDEIAGKQEFFVASVEKLPGEESSLQEIITAMRQSDVISYVRPLYSDLVPVSSVFGFHSLVAKGVQYDFEMITEIILSKEDSVRSYTVDFCEARKIL
jgi:hypothetical protein